MNYEQKFIEVLGEPHDNTALKDYITYVQNANVSDITEVYTEIHHILPISVFGKNDDVYILEYSQHINAHLKLAKAYPIREFLRPLNFMLPKKDRSLLEYRKFISEAAKKSWRDFKKTEKYQEWRMKRSLYMSEIMKNGLAAELSAKRWADPKARDVVSEHFKSLWQDDEYAARVKLAMKEERNSVEGKSRMIAVAKKSWETRSDTDRAIFKDKMSDINSNEEKRKDAGRKIKDKWNTLEFRDKMKNRKTGSNSSTMKEKWADPEFKQKMLDARRKI